MGAGSCDSMKKGIRVCYCTRTFEKEMSGRISSHGNLELDIGSLKQKAGGEDLGVTLIPRSQLLYHLLSPTHLFLHAESCASKAPL